MTNIPVAVGQVWVDNDPRVSTNGSRFVEVIGVEKTHAVVRGFRTHITSRQKTKRVYTRTSRIRLDRFKPTSTGYRRLS